MVKSGELSKEEAGFYLREAVKELIELSQKLEMKEGNWNVIQKDSNFYARRS